MTRGEGKGGGVLFCRSMVVAALPLFSWPLLIGSCYSQPSYCRVLGGVSVRSLRRLTHLVGFCPVVSFTPFLPSLLLSMVQSVSPSRNVMSVLNRRENVPTSPRTRSTKQGELPSACPLCPSPARPPRLFFREKTHRRTFSLVFFVLFSRFFCFVRSRFLFAFGCRLRMFFSVLFSLQMLSFSLALFCFGVVFVFCSSFLFFVANNFLFSFFVFVAFFSLLFSSVAFKQQER